MYYYNTIGNISPITLLKHSIPNKVDIHPLGINLTIRLELVTGSGGQSVTQIKQISHGNKFPVLTYCHVTHSYTKNKNMF